MHQYWLSRDNDRTSNRVCFLSVRCVGLLVVSCKETKFNEWISKIDQSFGYVVKCVVVVVVMNHEAGKGGGKPG